MCGTSVLPSLTVTGLALLAPEIMLGQDHPADIQFEVASVRANPLPGRPTGPTARITGGPGTSDPEHLRYERESMLRILAGAFQAQEDQFVCPGWIKSDDALDRFDIVANVRPGATAEQVNIMMQNLLKERFHLVYHIEKRNFEIYELVVAKGGPKLPKPGATEPDRSRLQGGASLNKEGFPILPPGRAGAQGSLSSGGSAYFNLKGLDGFNLASDSRLAGFSKAGVWRFSFQMATVGELLAVVQRFAGVLHAVDHSGLTGTYDAKLMFSGGSSASPGDVDEPAPDIFSALEKQLGLKLQKTKAPLDVIVIDKIDRTPTEN
jgi:uncharacterized protein (TIGR03435 family)